MTTRYATYSSVILFFSMLLYSLSAGAASLSSTVNRNTLSTNETLTLTVTSDEQVNASLLDLTPLTQDFQVLNSSPQSSTSFSSVNGRTTTVASTVWTITLVPKREGSLVIPALKVNNAESKAITVTVDNSKQVNSAAQPLQAWVIASGNQVYPSQQLLVEVELSAAADVRDLNGSPLLIKGAEVESLGQQTFQRIDNGVARQIVSLKYAVFANTPGEIIIPVMTFTGIQGGQRSFFANRGKQVVARTEQMNIKVLPQPSGAPHPWFPAEEVTISAAWSGDKSTLKAGVPITRTITITAKGQAASVIPPLIHPNNPEALKSYRDQAQLTSTPTENGFLSTRVESEALVANSSGEITLPELKVHWWNVNANEWEVATLAAQTLTVSGAATNTVAPRIDPSPPINVPLSSSKNWLWPSISGLFALLCLVQTVVILRMRRSPVANEPHTHENLPEAKRWRALQATVQAGDALTIRKAILSWAQSAMPNETPVTLMRLIELGQDDELVAAIQSLEHALYKGQNNFRVSLLKEPLTRLRARLANTNHHSKPASALPPLYKIT